MRWTPRLCNSDDNCTSESFECNNFVTVGCMQLIRSVTQNAISPIFPNVPGCGFWPFWPAPPAPAILRKNCYPTHPHAGHPRAPAGHWVTRATLPNTKDGSSVRTTAKTAAVQPVKTRHSSTRLEVKSSLLSSSSLCFHCLLIHFCQYFLKI